MAGGRYGHPHDITIETLCGIGADIYGTDIHGTIIITVDDSGYSLQLENPMPPVTPPPIYDLTIYTIGNGSTTGVGTYAEDTDVPITAIADPGWVFVDWTGDAVADANSASTTILMDGNKTVTANFRTGILPIDIQITHINFDGEVYLYESDEFVEITNLGSESVDLHGWTLRDADPDEADQSFTFPSPIQNPRVILNPGASVRVYTNEIHWESGGFSFGSTVAIWHNTEPDTVVLIDDEGNEVSRSSY
jgi:uncharacterized repeat protein (TIGR02543 family)